MTLDLPEPAAQHTSQPAAPGTNPANTSPLLTKILNKSLSQYRYQTKNKTDTKKYYDQQNRDALLKYKKEYYQKYKAQILEKKKITNKAYYEQNKEKIKEQRKLSNYNKKYYEQNKEKLLAKVKERYFAKKKQKQEELNEE